MSRLTYWYNNNMQIKELARATGVDAETIRFYEKKGLLQKPIRRENNYREYASTDLERLSFIRHCRALDISIADITELLEFVAEPTVDCHNVDNLIDSHLKRVRARLKSMRALEKQLLQLRDQCTGRLDGNCGIINELVAAAHQEANASAITKKPR